MSVFKIKFSTKVGVYDIMCIICSFPFQTNVWYMSVFIIKLFIYGIC